MRKGFLEMQDQLDELFNLLEQYLGLYENLGRLLDRERTALIDLDLDRLQRMTKIKETEVLKVKLLLPALTKAIQGSALVLGLPSEPLPALASLAGAAPEPWSSRLNRTGLTLARLKRNAARNNEANHRFVQEALDMISGSISMLTGAALVPNGGYLSNGQHTNSANCGPMKLSREV